MHVGPYRLLDQIGAGPDGVAYRAEHAETVQPAVVHLLVGARERPDRWHILEKRLTALSLFNHPARLAILHSDLAGQPPFLAIETGCEATFLQAFENRRPLALISAVGPILEIAQCVAAAHRVGVSHGSLAPNSIFLCGRDQLRLDFLDLQTQRMASDEWKPIFQAPEGPVEGPTGFPADVYSLGALLYWMVAANPPRQRGRKDAPAFSSDLLPEGVRDAAAPLIGECLADEPGDRPTIDRLVNDLAALLTPRKVQQTIEFLGGDGNESNLATPEAANRVIGAGGPPAKMRPAPGDGQGLPMPSQLGRYAILEKLGQGAMGAVYRARDVAQGSLVALKVLRDFSRQQNSATIKRFHKEARLLSEVNNPYVANLLEINCDQGIYFLVIEYVDGQSLAKVIQERQALPELTAVAIMANVARGLADAHERGIVHRDIKPDNILLAKNAGSSGNSSAFEAGSEYRVKLTDFGLARHVVETESLNLTQAGAVVGTPTYMAPEQCRGQALDSRTDVYGMGATLFHMVAGRPPFQSDSVVGMIDLHCNEPAPLLNALNAQISDALSLIVDKCLAKAPGQRYPHARALLADLERLLKGQPTSMALHPHLPTADAKTVLKYDWLWEMESTPEALWPHVSNTERLNRAVGLTAVSFSEEDSDSEAEAAGDFTPRRKRFGEFKRLGVTAAWEEFPFEWIEARRMGVLREYHRGPFRWLVSIVELTPRPGGGALLAHRVRIEPNGLLGRTLAAVEVGVKGKRAVERVYRRIDASLTGKLGESIKGLADPFEEPTPLDTDARRRLETYLDALSRLGLDPTVLERFGEFLAAAPAQEVARIRPLVLARRLEVSAENMIAVCLHAARQGLVALLWDIVCPVCRIPADLKETLKAVKHHGRCPACRIDFELDFARSVELIFRANPLIREVETGVYCIGGPAHSPHVVSQIRLKPKETFDLDLNLGPGAYRLRSPQLARVLDFTVHSRGPRSRWDIILSRGLPDGMPRVLTAGSQQISLTNDFPEEVVVRVERKAPREDALTAAGVAANALFRELFPGEVLSSGERVVLSDVTLLVTRLMDADRLFQNLDDGPAFAVFHEHVRLLEEEVRHEGGAVVKALDEGIVAAFTEPAAALRVGLKLPDRLKQTNAGSIQLCGGVHRGPAMAVTINDHLDYFGVMIRQAVHFPQLAGPNELILSQEVVSDPAASRLLEDRFPTFFQADVPGRNAASLYRLSLADASECKTAFMAR